MLDRKTNRPALIAYTLAKPTKPALKPNFAKEYAIATAFLPTLKTNFFGNSSATIERILDYNKLIMNKAQHTTRNIAKSGEVLNWSGFSPFGHHLGLLLNSSQSASCHIATL
jgi:hypothetical protein